MADVTTNLPDFSTAIVNAQTGAIDPAWFQFFMKLFDRTGGAGGTNGMQDHVLLNDVVAFLGSAIGVPNEKPVPVFGDDTVPALRLPQQFLTGDVSAHGLQTDDQHHAPVTSTLNGFMLAADKVKLDGMASGAAVASVAATAPITSSGGANPNIGISPTPTFTTVTLTNGQVVFPATQVPSANANTLDDYREGTYTPTITAGAGTLTSVAANGSYTKIGRQVTVNISIAITTNGTGAASLVATLPFPVGAGNEALGFGRENNLTGKMLQAWGASATVGIVNYDNTYPGGSGSAHFITVVYFV